MATFSFKIFLVKFRQTFFFRFAVQELKGISNAFASLLFEGGRFSVFGAFRGGLEIAVFVAFFRFWKIAEHRVLFYYMPAYGATLSPTSSVLRLLPLAGPLGEPLRQFWGPARNLYCQGQPRIGVYLGRVGPLVGPWRNRFGPGPDLYNRC